MNIKTKDVKARDIKAKAPAGSKIKVSDIKSKRIALKAGTPITVTTRKIKSASVKPGKKGRVQGETYYRAPKAIGRSALPLARENKKPKDQIKRRLNNRAAARRAEYKIKTEARSITSKEGDYPESESAYATNRFSYGSERAIRRGLDGTKESGKKIYRATGTNPRIKERLLYGNSPSNGRVAGTRIRGISPSRIETAKYVKGRQDSKPYASYGDQNGIKVKSSPVNNQVSHKAPSSQRTVNQDTRPQAMGKARVIRRHQEKTLAKNAAPKRPIKNGRKAASNIAASLKRMYEGGKALVGLIVGGGTVAISIIIICVMFGAAFNIFGDTSSKNYEPVSAEVEAYTPIIKIYAEKHGVPEFVDLIKAVMMQESGGRGTDPMQCAESGYNTRFPNVPNGITDPEYSIDIGVKTLAASLKQAEVENPIDMDRIRLALQGYNYGNGYIDWAVTRDGGYTVENASAFSDMMAEKMGWSGYGDKQYVAHVLRYYPFGKYNYGIGNQVIVNLAAEQLGNEGGQKFWSYWGYGGRIEWCAAFVSWCADQCGYIEAGIIPRFMGVDTGVNFYKERGQWQNPGYVPAAGDIIFFDWEPDGICDHVGFVESSDGTYVYTIEGNSSDMCAKRQYSVNSIWIYGYGVPAY